MPQKSRRNGKPSSTSNHLLNNGHLLPVNVGLSLVTHLLIELTAEEKDFLVCHLFPILSPLCFLSFTEAMLVAQKDTKDLLLETNYHHQLFQWEQNGKYGKKPSSPTYRYHAFRKSTREISTDEEILLFGGVKKLTIPQMIHLHLVHGAYDRLAQYTQSRHRDQRRSEGTTCWEIIAKWFNNPSHLTPQQRATLTPHLPSSSPMTPRARKRISTSPAAAPRKNKRARNNLESISIAATSMAGPAPTLHVDSSIHPSASASAPPSQPPPPTPSPQLFQDYPLSTIDKSWYHSQPNNHHHRLESESGFYHTLGNTFGLSEMNEREEEMEAFRGRVSFTPSPPPFQTHVPVNESFPTTSAALNIATIPPPTSTILHCDGGGSDACKDAGGMTIDELVNSWLSPEFSSCSSFTIDSPCTPFSLGDPSDLDVNTLPSLLYPSPSSPSPFPTLSPTPTPFPQTVLLSFDA